MEPTVTMDWRERPYQIAFMISAAFNFCVVLYFSLFLTIHYALAKCFQDDNRLSVAHKKIPNFMHCFYFNLVMYPCLVVEAFFLAFTSFPLEAAYQGDLPFTVIGFFSTVFGIRLFFVGRDLLLLKNTRVKLLVLFVHAVYLLLVGNVILTESAAVMAFIAITCEGELFMVNIGKMLRQLGYKRTSCYRATMFIGCYSSIIFRALIPLALLGISLIQGRPFDMTPSSMAIFFLALVVYGVVNTWYVNSSIARICKKRVRVIEVPYANFVQEVDDTLKEGEDEIPPSYQDACQEGEDLATVSGASDTSTQATIHAAAEMVPRDLQFDQSRTFADNGRIDMPAIFLRDRQEPYYYENGAISCA